MNNYAADLYDFSYTGSGATPPGPTVFEKFVDKGAGYLGTGTSWQIFYTNLSGSMVFEEPRPQDTRVPIKAIQDRICQAFSLSTTELATACHKSRKALYDWIHGSEPRPDSAERLFQLCRAANDWLDSSNPIPKTRLREPLLAGRSLLDLLVADEIDLDAIAFLRRRLDLETLDGLDLDDPLA